MKKSILILGFTIALGMFLTNSVSAQSAWGANPTTNPYNIGIGSLATGAHAIDVFNTGVSNIRITRNALGANDVVGRFQIVNSSNNAQLVMVLRKVGGVNEMLQSANSPTHGFLEYLYLNLDTRKYEIRSGIGLAEWKNSGNVLFNNTGGVGIGVSTMPAGAKLAVNGKINAKEVEVTLSGWSDFVFADDFNLRPLSEVEEFISINKHLPDVPSEAEILQNGVNLGEMSSILLQKIEELTLYTIELNKRIAELEGR